MRGRPHTMMRSQEAAAPVLVRGPVVIVRKRLRGRSAVDAVLSRWPARVARAVLVLRVLVRVLASQTTATRYVSRPMRNIHGYGSFSWETVMLLAAPCSSRHRLRRVWRRVGQRHSCIERGAQKVGCIDRFLM